MKLSKFELLSDITEGFGAAGTLAVLIGGASCIVGLSGTGLMKVGEFLSSHQPTLQKMMFYGSAGSGAGLFFLGVAAAASKFRDEEGDREMAAIANAYTADVKAIQERGDRLSGCAGCKYWHGRTYEGNFLACTVHPDGKENCPDWEPQDND